MRERSGKLYKVLVMKTITMKIAVVLLLCQCMVAQGSRENQYKLLATTRTSTMEKELNEAADAGYRLTGVMGGEMRGGEIISVLERLPDGEKGRYGYKLLATKKTSTMQKELQAAGDEGYNYKGDTARGELMVILEIDRRAQDRPKYEYRLLATSKTSTMQKELNAATEQGFQLMGIFRRAEVVCVLRRQVR